MLHFAWVLDRIPRNSATQRNSKDTTNAGGKDQHVIMLFHHHGGSCTAVSACLPLAAFQLPAFCADACLTLPLTTQLDFEPLYHSAGSSACLITVICRRVELGGWGRMLFVNVRNLFMVQWMRLGDRDRPVVLCWPNSGGYSRRNRASPRCLQCVCFVNCEAAARCILARSTNAKSYL